MAKQITDNASKSPVSTTDLLLVRDVTSNTDKKTTVSGISPAVASSLPALSVQKAALEKPHYNALFLATGGVSGGLVIAANTQNWFAFDVADTVNGNGITATTGANPYLTVVRDGLYEMSSQWWASDGVGGTSFIQWWAFSFDNGATWMTFRESDRPIATGTTGQNYSTKHWLPAGARVRVDVYNGGNSLRLAGPGNTYNQRFYFGPKFSLAEIR